MVTNESTDPSSLTQVFEDGERVFPCHCGETHRGPYAFENWMHHACLHERGFVYYMKDIGFNDVMCDLCGATFPITGEV